jgi:arylsulfatase A-like enzyme
LALQVPADSLAEYAGQFSETPYRGSRGYLPHRQPRAAYAAMITRMDSDVGRLLTLIKSLGLEERTIVVFTSDNGPLYDGLGGTDTEFFNSAAGLRGRKGSFYEGGFRVPCLVRWPGHVAAGSTSNRVTGFEDWLPTLLELVGAHNRVPGVLDGISFARSLLGVSQPARPFLYRESPGYGGQQCIRVGDWKALRRNLNPNSQSRSSQPSTIELYDLVTDPSETTDLADKYPQVVARLRDLMAEEHQKSALFPIRELDRDR